MESSRPSKKKTSSLSNRNTCFCSYKIKWRSLENQMVFNQRNKRVCDATLRNHQSGIPRLAYGEAKWEMHWQQRGAGWVMQKVCTQRLKGKRNKGKQNEERWKMLTEDPGNKLCRNRSKIKKEKIENNKANYREFLKRHVSGTKLSGILLI